MSELPIQQGGLRVLSGIVPASSASTYGTHYSYLGVGGYVEVPNIDYRNSIPPDSNMNDEGYSTGRRRYGMMVYVIDEDKLYRLFPFSGGSIVSMETFTGTSELNQVTMLSNNNGWIEVPDLSVLITGGTYFSGNSSIVLYDSTGGTVSITGITTTDIINPGDGRVLVSTGNSENIFVAQSNMVFNGTNLNITGGTFITDSGGSLHSSAIIQFKSTTKGVLLPGMTTSQKNAIVNPTTGLTVYDSTIEDISVYTSSGWTGVIAERDNLQKVTERGNSTNTGLIISGTTYIIGSGSTTGNTFVTSNSANTQTFTIKDNGNVLIGTTTDTGYKLDVNGRGHFTNGLVLEQSGYAGFINNGMYSSMGYNTNPENNNTVLKIGFGAGTSVTTLLKLDNSTNVTQPFGGSTVLLDLIANPSQTNNIIQWRNSSGVVLGVVNNLGHIGIGTTGSTEQRLFVSGSTLFRSTGTTSGSTAFSVQNSTGGTLLNLFSNGNLNVDNGALYVDGDNGRVGIGTSTLGTSTELTVSSSQTASSAIARGQLLNTTLVASANNDVLVGLDIVPTYTNGAFTGVSNIALRATGRALFNASLGEVSSFQGYGADVLRIHANGNGLLEIGQNLLTPVGVNAKAAIYNRNNNYAAIVINVPANQLGLGSKISWSNQGQGGGSIYHSDAVVLDMGMVNQSGHYIHMFANGNVLLTVGTRTDAGYKLDVNGTARIQGNTEISRSGSDTQLTIARGGGAGFTIQAKANSTSQTEGINLYWTADTWLKFILGSSVVANFSNSGNFLVGTSTDAGYKLDVNGSTRIVGTGTTSGSTAFLVQNSTGGTLLNLSNNGNLNVDNGALYVDGDNGRVGIGTTSPTARLQVRGTGLTSATTLLLLQNSGGTQLGYVDDSGQCVIGTGSPGTPNFGFYPLSINGLNGLYISTTNNSAYNAIVVNNDFLINGAGVVQLGRSTASTTFNASTHQFNIGSTSNRITTTTGGGFEQAFTFAGSYGQSRTFTVGSGLSKQGLWYDTGSALGIYRNTFPDTSSPVLIASTTGNVLIGTTTDANYRLDVSGTTRVVSTGSTSGSTTLTLQNSTGRTTTEFRSDGVIGISSASTFTTQVTSVISASTTNSGIAIVPNGTGAFTLSIPDGTATGGDARGTNAIDLQTRRALSNQVASAIGSSILGGTSNKVNTSGAAGNNSVIVAGNLNTIQGNNKGSVFIGAGSSNIIDGNASVIVGGNSNTSFANSTFIGGGDSNTANGTLSIIVGGSNNQSSANYTTVVGGQSNTASASHGTVSGGQSNVASTGTHSTVIGGLSNTASGQYSIVGGQSNTSSTSNSSILGGWLNINSGGSYGSIVGGRSNVLSTGSWYSFIGAGWNNGIINGDYSVVVGGFSNSATTQYAAVIGGSGNRSTGLYSLTHGLGNTASSSGSTAIGFYNTASGAHSVAMGSGNTATGQGSVSMGIGNNIPYKWSTAFGATHTIGQESVFVAGLSNIVNGEYSTSMGTGNNVSGTAGVAIGRSLTVSGNYGAAFGYLSTASGFGSLSVGYYATASGPSSVAIGSTLTAESTYGIALGYQSKATLYGQIAVSSISLGSDYGNSQQSTVVASRLTSATSGGTITLSLDGTGTTNLIVPNGNNRAWNVVVNTITVCTVVSGGTLTVGDAHSGEYKFLFKRVGGTSTISPITTSSEVADTSMATASYSFSAGTSQQMEITFNAPNTANNSTFRAVAKVALTEVAW